MKAGAARICITPPVGVELSGYVDREQPSIGVHDELYGRGLYLEEGQEKFLWLHCDLIGFMRERVCSLRQELAAKLGLEERQVILSATHTHAGPATLPLRHCGRLDAAYLEKLDRQLLDVARNAIAEPQPVTLRFAESRCVLARDRRRSSINSHVDERLPVLAFMRQDGSYLALVANYAMHNVALSYGNRLISGDVAGVAAEVVHRRLPGKPIILMTNGGCGNTNPPQVSPGLTLMEKYGQQLGDAVAQTAESGQLCSASGLATMMETLELPLIVPSRAEIFQAYNNACNGFTENPRWRSAIQDWRDETFALLEENPPKSIRSDLWVLQIGPVNFVTIGAEVFSRMAEELRAARGPHCYVVGYANGNIGYLPFREIYEEGGYEVDLAYKFYMNFMIAPGGYEKLRDRAVELLFALDHSFTALGSEP